MVRVKRRYIVLEIKYKKGSRDKDAFMRELRDKVGHLYGDFGVACLNRGFSVKKYDPKDGFMVLAVRKGVHELVMSVAPLITTVDDNPCSVNIIHLSGTIRCCLKQLKKVYIMNLRASIAANQVKNIQRITIEDLD